MKNFEMAFNSIKGCNIGVECLNMNCQECKVIAKYWYRQALKFAENQFIGKSAFEAEEAINKELRDLL